MNSNSNTIEPGVYVYVSPGDHLAQVLFVEGCQAGQGFARVRWATRRDEEDVEIARMEVIAMDGTRPRRRSQVREREAEKSAPSEQSRKRAKPLKAEEDEGDETTLAPFDIIHVKAEIKAEEEEGDDETTLVPVDITNFKAEIKAEEEEGDDETTLVPVDITNVKAEIKAEEEEGKSRSQDDPPKVDKKDVDAILMYFQDFLASPHSNPDKRRRMALNN